jgi:hypothetical protein
MSFAWLHKKISRRASIVAICLAILLTIACLQVSLSIYESKIDGDTPEICRLYLEQSAFVHDHFGKLREERFLRGESMTFTQDPSLGTMGLCTFKISGTKAKGTLKMVWARELDSGALTVSIMNIVDEFPLSNPVKADDQKGAAPEISGLPNGQMALVFSGFEMMR